MAQKHVHLHRFFRITVGITNVGFFPAGGAAVRADGQNGQGGGVGAGPEPGDPVAAVYSGQDQVNHAESDGTGGQRLFGLVGAGGRHHGIAFRFQTVAKRVHEGGVG